MAKPCSPSIVVLLAAAWTAATVHAEGKPAASLQRVTPNPAEVELTGPGAVYRLLIDGDLETGFTVDLTRRAAFRSHDPKIVEIGETGLLRSVSDGTTSVDVNVEGRTFTVPVVVRNSSAPRAFHFENDVVPILSRFGCNASGCHGKAEGQNGFKLSVFGFDPVADRAALIGEARGRRVFPAAPEQSLVLQKASGGMPHGGGIRIPRGSSEYRTLRDWIAAGTPAGDPRAPHVTEIRLVPSERRMPMRESQQLRVVARWSNGSEADVTQHARFQTNNEELARVDDFGLVATGNTPGEAAIMASYMGTVGVFRALVPRAESAGSEPRPPVYNFIDELVDARLKKLNIAPSGLADDAEFLRRVSLDCIGVLPTAEETRAFLADSHPDRRARLVDALLDRPEFAEYWALKWSDLLRVDRLTLGHKQAYAYYAWIRDAFDRNQPWDELVREILAAEGLLKNHPAGYLYKVETNPGRIASTVSQVFLGVRIECAQCHHHPYDRWSQTDYFGMQAYFTQLKSKSTPEGELLASLAGEKTLHPRTGEEVFAHPLGTANPATSPEGDRRRLLAAWLTAPENPWFARSFVNRVWAHFAGRGLVEPVDDFRLTNPPTNPALLDALAAHFVERKFDVRALVRTICLSRTYQLSSRPNATNERDEQNYSRALFKRLDAEVLFDAICRTTGVGEKFAGVPTGVRAVQLWDSQVPHYFLRTFGRPVRATACQCERTVEPNVSQVLHVLNSPEIQGKLSHAGGRIAALVDRFDGDDPRLVEELYLTFFNRYPEEKERAAAVDYMAGNARDRRRAAEDLAWTMMNSVEFLFNH